MTGIICVNKPKDITSFGVVAKVRGITREKKCGHTGTLDPMATGVLPIMLGGATKLLNYIPDSDKRYKAHFVLGKTTDTLDITGKVLTESEVVANEDDVRSVLSEFRGLVSQIPPMYSAVSVDGERLYDLARKGIEVEREARQVEIKQLELLPSENGEYVIDVRCSKGTYIRTLIDDIGRRLGCGAVMTQLERTEASGFTLADCVTLDELQKRRDESLGFDDIVHPTDEILSPYSAVYVSEAQAKRFANGGALDINRIKKTLESGLFRVYSPDGLLLGLGEADLDSCELKVARLITKRD